jgi:hypothetical protein
MDSQTMETTKNKGDAKIIILLQKALFLHKLHLNMSLPDIQRVFRTSIQPQEVQDNLIILYRVKN